MVPGLMMHSIQQLHQHSISFSKRHGTKEPNSDRLCLWACVMEGQNLDLREAKCSSPSHGPTTTLEPSSQQVH